MTTPHPLDNPVWFALSGPHRSLALRRGGAARYPADVAPFVAVEDASTSACDAATCLVAPGERVCFVGLVPALPRTWHVEESASIAQMIRYAPLAVPDGPNAVELGEAHVADLLGLTALVYPHYFRARTIAMGRYFGIYEGRRLAAMAGERLAFDGYREISAVCTHPDHVGRGYATRLIALLTNDILGDGEVPFLHFSHANIRAKALYEKLGYRQRADIALLAVAKPRDSLD